MTTEEESNRQRRKILLATTAAVGGIGVVAATVPFVASMAPSEAARAAGAPVEVDISTIAPGQLVTVEFRGKPIWVLHRTERMLAELNNHTALLVDPDLSQPMEPPYVEKPTRALKPQFMVVTAICTHLGCVPSFRPEPNDPALGADWPGGFYCPCHGSKFDLAGRVFKNVPAPVNMEVPRHQYLSETVLQIGADEKIT
jgi:ubiquinol-cytochrome c reductase iron-sulfur subunit